MSLMRVVETDLYYRDETFADPWPPHDTVMLQHGFGRSGIMYHGWVPHLNRDYRVIRMELRGAGKSPDLGTDIQLTFNGFMSDFIGLTNALNVERIHSVGESLGSILGAALAATHPE
jgi:3-oxoadipate enol-lactonase